MACLNEYDLWHIIAVSFEHSTLITFLLKHKFHVYEGE